MSLIASATLRPRHATGTSQRRIGALFRVISGVIDVVSANVGSSEAVADTDVASSGGRRSKLNASPSCDIAPSGTGLPIKL